MVVTMVMVRMSVREHVVIMIMIVHVVIVHLVVRASVSAPG